MSNALVEILDTLGALAMMPVTMIAFGVTVAYGVVFLSARNRKAIRRLVREVADLLEQMPEKMRKVYLASMQEAETERTRETYRLVRMELVNRFVKV